MVSSSSQVSSVSPSASPVSRASSLLASSIPAGATNAFTVYRDQWTAADLWPLVRDSGRFDDVFPIPEERVYWTELLERMLTRSEFDTWDFQWWLTSWVNNGLHVWPNAPLIRNIGFDADGSHTFADCPEAAYANVELKPLAEIIHSELVLPSRAADHFAFFHRRFVAPAEPALKLHGLMAWQLRLEALLSEGLLPYLHSRLSRVRQQLPR